MYYMERLSIFEFKKRSLEESSWSSSINKTLKKTNERQSNLLEFLNYLIMKPEGEQQDVAPSNFYGVGQQAAVGVQQQVNAWMNSNWTQGALQARSGTSEMIEESHFIRMEHETSQTRSSFSIAWAKLAMAQDVRQKWARRGSPSLAKERLFIHPGNEYQIHERRWDYDFSQFYDRIFIFRKSPFQMLSLSKLLAVGSFFFMNRWSLSNETFE